MGIWEQIPSIHKSKGADPRLSLRRSGAANTRYSRMARRNRDRHSYKVANDHIMGRQRLPWKALPAQAIRHVKVSGNPQAVSNRSQWSAANQWDTSCQ